MPTHYEILGIASDAKPDDIVKGWQNAVVGVRQRHGLFPTSVAAVRDYCKVQAAYDCLIKPESRAEYDAMLQELAAEERSLFGERKARRRAKEEELKQVNSEPPPYVWNEDTNTPLFWTPGRKLIEGPKPEEEATPVAYYRRASLDKALVLASAAADSSSSDTPKPTTPPPKYSPRPRLSTPPASARPTLSLQTSYSHNISPASAKPSVQQKRGAVTQAPIMSAADYMLLQKANTQAAEERHRRKVEGERLKALHELEKRQRAIAKEQRKRLELEIEARKIVERERENLAREIELLRLREEKDKLREEKERLRLETKATKQVRWGYAEVAPEPLYEGHMIETGPYPDYDGWYSEPEPPRRRPNVLRKLRKAIF